MVVVAHYFAETPHGASVFAWGWLGVSIFFVLSGFLIGGIVLDQGSEDQFLRSFWVKRAARILPPYVLTLAFAFLVYQIFKQRPWMDEFYAVGYYLTFTQNFAIAFFGEGSKWLAPTWTLAVEEQFYLLLPLLIGILPARALLPCLGTLWAGATLFRWAIHDTLPLGALSLLPSRMDLLLAGVLFAVAFRRVDVGQRLALLRAIPLAAVLLVLIVRLGGDHKLFVVLTPAIVSVGAGSYILALALGAPEGRRFSGPIMGFFGTISYGLYLFHQPVSGLMHGLILNQIPDIGTTASLAVTLMAIVVSVMVAYASWRFVEAPILAWARQSREGRGALRERWPP